MAMQTHPPIYLDGIAVNRADYMQPLHLPNPVAAGTALEIEQESTILMASTFKTADEWAIMKNFAELEYRLSYVLSVSAGLVPCNSGSWMKPSGNNYYYFCGSLCGQGQVLARLQVKLNTEGQIHI